MKMFLLIFLFLSLQQTAFAKPIVYERGGATDSMGIVDEGAVHLELGFIGYDQNFSPEQHSFALAPALFRWGLVQDRFELRLSGSGLVMQNNDLSYQNITLGTKTALYHNRDKQFQPRLNMVSNFSIPTANTGDGTERRFDYFNKFLFEQSLTKKVDLLLSFGPDFTRIKNTEGEYGAFSLPWVVSLTHKTTKRFIPFVQIFGVKSFTSSIPSRLGVDTGMNYIINDDLVFDLTFFMGLNEATPDFTMNTGLSMKL